MERCDQRFDGEGEKMGKTKKRGGNNPVMEGMEVERIH
jgi:hypothetical protein